MRIDDLLQPYADELVKAMVDLATNKKYPPTARVQMARALLSYLATRSDAQPVPAQTLETVRALLEQYE